MSNPTIRISDSTTFPDVSAVHDVGSSIDITSLDDIDMGLLANQKKLISSSSPRPQSPGNSMSLKSASESGSGGGDGIEFVNLEDTNVTFDVKPSVGTSDTIKILRDSAPAAPRYEPTMTLNSGPQLSAPAAAPAAAPAPAPAKSWFSGFSGIGSGNNGGSGGNSSGGGISSWFGGGSSNSASNDTEHVSTYLTPEEESAKKTQGLTLLERMDRAGVGGTKMTMANTLDEINVEVARRKDSKGLEASMRFQRSMLRTVTSGLEFLNSRYDPLGVGLDGWSEQVNENIEDYDEIFEELYDKYKDKSKVAPEVRLVMSLGLSAATCHITNTMFKSKMPGAAEILRNNPDLARQMAQAAAAQAVGPGFAKFVGMGGGGHNSAASAAMNPPTPPHEMNMGGGSMGGFMPPMGSGMGAEIPTMDPRGAPDFSQPIRTARREMRGPTGVDDILRASMGEGNGRVVPPVSNIEAEETGSIGSGITTETMRRNGLGGRRRKATVVQPTGATLTLNV